jgi:hypothetical protein
VGELAAKCVALHGDQLGVPPHHLVPADLRIGQVPSCPQVVIDRGWPPDSMASAQPLGRHVTEQRGEHAEGIAVGGPLRLQLALEGIERRRQLSQRLRRVGVHLIKSLPERGGERRHPGVEALPARVLLPQSRIEIRSELPVEVGVELPAMDVEPVAELLLRQLDDRAVGRLRHDRAPSLIAVPTRHHAKSCRGTNQPRFRATFGPCPWCAGERLAVRRRARLSGV